MAVVYLHKRNDTNEVFYVGIGKTKRRAYRKDKRNPHWTNIVEKFGYTVDLLVSNTPWEDACKIEKLLIEKYGRKDLGIGPLVNMTDGGDGQLGNAPWNKGIEQLEETKNKISLFQRNRQNIKGYTFHKKLNKYQAQIRVGDKKIYLGLFNTPSEAEEAYKNARIRYFG